MLHIKQCIYHAMETVGTGRAEFLRHNLIQLSTKITQILLTPAAVVHNKY